MTPITASRLAFTPDGTPFSEAFGDVYHSADGGLAQAQQVFLAGNGLPERWQGRGRFVIVETGFGLGLNFLASWAAWRADPGRSQRLHFVSCERHPFEHDDLAQLHARWPELAEMADALRAAWPPLTPGIHRLHFEDDRVCLTLYFGDARDGLAQLVCQADAFLLDGFSPARNPDMWSARIFHLLARLAAPDATLATWSVAGEVREGLRRAGFTVEKAPGFGAKRQMLIGRLAAPATTHKAQDASAPGSPRRARIVHHPSSIAAARHAIVIGAGLAGSACAERLAARGWRVDVLDAAEGPGQGASGNHAGVLRPLPNLDDNRISRLTRAGTLYGWRHIERLRAHGLCVRAESCGVLHLARDPAQQDTMHQVVERLGLPASVLSFVSAAEASERCGWPVPLGGWWFAESGWVQPPSLCAANLAVHPVQIKARFGCSIERIEQTSEGWSVFDGANSIVARAPVLVLAAGTRVIQFPQATAVPVVSARGQVSLLDAPADSAPRVVVCRMGYVSPAIDGLRCAGASFDVDDHETGLRERDHLDNIATLEAMLPGYTAALDLTRLGGRVGFRPTSPDRLPMVGAMPVAAPLMAASFSAATPLAAVARQPGLYVLSGFGARGLVWSALAGELLAAQLEGEPLPVERDLCDALDPARYLLRPAIRPTRDD